MPKDTPDCPKKSTIDEKAKEARARLQKFKDDHSNFTLDIDLQVVDDNLRFIAQDNHKAQ